MSRAVDRSEATLASVDGASEKPDSLVALLEVANQRLLEETIEIELSWLRNVRADLVDRLADGDELTDRERDAFNDAVVEIDVQLATPRAELVAQMRERLELRRRKTSPATNGGAA